MDSSNIRFLLRDSSSSPSSMSGFSTSLSDHFLEGRSGNADSGCLSLNGSVTPTDSGEESSSPVVCPPPGLQVEDYEGKVVTPVDPEEIQILSSKPLLKTAEVFRTDFH